MEAGATSFPGYSLGTHTIHGSNLSAEDHSSNMRATTVAPPPQLVVPLNLLIICVLHSSLSSGPAASNSRKLIGFLSVRVSLLGFTTASTRNNAISPFLVKSMCVTRGCMGRYTGCFGQTLQGTRKLSSLQPSAVFDVATDVLIRAMTKLVSHKPIP